MDIASLDEHVLQYFEIVPADQPALLEQVYRVRYAVYCQEFHFEREEDCPGGLERDDYDAHSRHLLIVHRTSGIAAGSVRMVRPPPDQPDLPLPIERYCGTSLNHPERHPSLVPRDRIAEISRLAVHTAFRRRAGESESPIGAISAQAFSEREHRTFPLLSLALFAGATALLSQAGREQVFVMMEPRLGRRLRSLGIPFVRVGEPLDYHGWRAPYHVRVQECLDGWSELMQGLYRQIRQAIEPPSTS